ncbi:hypothetical protein AFK24_15250 [Pseudomonas syringae]|uniref:Uncharacterized protein n=2 Tax=Pseudomonas syringae TaxID=317 RepID=A0A1C7Z4N6_PSESX|nr:hypothetical protein AFK24_15250 [Pseudomonas syringae]
MSGWGAILTFGRTELNRLIKEQYIRGFEGLQFLLPFSETFPVGNIGDNSEQVELRGIVLGVPTLSFESASLNEAVLTVTMSIVGGTFTSFRHAAGVPPSVLSSFNISEVMGFNVSMQASVNSMIGEVDSSGVVTLDLTLSSEVTCNLGSVKKVQDQIGEYFQRYFVGQQNSQRRFVLGMLKLDNYNPLSPTRFAIRVQRAPGADQRLAANFGDGAVVVFIRLKVQDGESMPGTPIEGSGFPYLIPDDQTDGLPLYSAALMVDQRLRPLVDEEQLDLLKSLIFPNQNRFDEVSRHEPHDLAIFGNIRESSSSVSIQPSAVMLGAEQEQTFVARRNDGSVVANVQWAVRSPDFPGSQGRITSSGGVYTANAQSTMYRNRLPMVVTASYYQEGEEQKASALVHERFESMSVAPLVQIRSGTDKTAIAIRASTLGSGPLLFRIIEPAAGARLEPVDANHENYFPPPVVQPEAILVQKIQISDPDGEQAIATIVLLNKPNYLELEPYYVKGLGPRETVEFKQLNDQIDPTLLGWSVLGEGEVDEERGIFTAPATPTSMISVVVCELPSPGPEWPSQYGYSIVNLQPLETEYIPPRWESLQEFSISAPNSPPGVSAQGYANGFQQIPIVITLETKTIEVDGQQLHVPVSDVELSTLRLVEKFSDGHVRFIDDLQEGIEYGSDLPYAAHTRPNRFSLYSATLAGKNARHALPTPKNNGTRYRELYVHMAVEGSRTFYAEFQADDGTTWRSDSNIGGEGELTVLGVKPPVLNAAHYELVRDRAFNGQGNDGPPENPDPFSYYLDSVDYWHLSYMRLGTYPVLFATLRVENNTSTIQWESEYCEETFFSYTGYAFYPAPYRANNAPPDGLSFDIYYRALLSVSSLDEVDRSIVSGKEPSPGELIVSLHRVPDMKYWHDGLAGGDELKKFRRILDRPVVFVLLDEEGNRHRVQIGFDAPTIDDSRNRLMLTLQ